MPRNIELKARLANFEQAVQTCERIATERLPDQRQVDTYFQVAQGRLKLREIDGGPAELVWYQRMNTTSAKGSDYELTRILEPSSLKRSLRGALGVRIVVDKFRRIWLWHNVRIHLDEVVGLGNFLEFEAVLSGDINDARGQDQVAFLTTEFALQTGDLLAESYSDLLECSRP